MDSCGHGMSATSLQHSPGGRVVLLLLLGAICNAAPQTPPPAPGASHLQPTPKPYHPSSTPTDHQYMHSEDQRPVNSKASPFSQSVFEEGAHNQRLSSGSSAHALHATHRKPNEQEASLEMSTTNTPSDRLQQYEAHDKHNPDKQEPQHNAWQAEKESEGNETRSEEEGGNMFEDLQELLGDLYLAPGLRLSDLHGQGREGPDEEGVALYDGEDWMDIEHNSSKSRGEAHFEHNSTNDVGDDYDGNNDDAGDDNFGEDGDGGAGMIYAGNPYSDNVHRSHDSDNYGDHGAASIDTNNDNYFGADYFRNHYEQGHGSGIPARPAGMGGAGDGKARVVARQHPVQPWTSDRGDGITRHGQTAGFHRASVTKRGRSTGSKRGRWSTTRGRWKGKKVFRWGR